MISQLITPSDLCEFKFAEGKDNWSFEGYASVFNSEDQIGDTVLPGAFKSCIEQKGAGGIFMRYEHLRHTTPGKWTHVEEDSRGFVVAGELTKGHSIASDIRASFKHETIKGLSIGWVPSNSVIERKPGGRILKSVDVFEISITANPMEVGAEVTSFKSEIETISSMKDAEAFLRESGILSKSMATLFVGHLKSLVRSESEKVFEEELNELKTRIEVDHSTDKLLSIISNL